MFSSDSVNGLIRYHRPVALPFVAALAMLGCGGTQRPIPDEAGNQQSYAPTECVTNASAEDQRSARSLGQSIMRLAANRDSAGLAALVARPSLVATLLVTERRNPGLFHDMAMREIGDCLTSTPANVFLYVAFRHPANVLRLRSADEMYTFQFDRTADGLRLDHVHFDSRF